MKKRILISILFLASFNMYSQLRFNIIHNSGMGDILSDDIGKLKFDIQDVGYSSDLKLFAEYGDILNFGIGYQFATIGNKFYDYGPQSLERELFFTSNLNGVKLLIDLNVLQLIRKNRLGGGIGGYLNINNAKIKRETDIPFIVNKRSVFFEESKTGLVIGSNIYLTYLIEKIQIGLETELGFCNHDFLDGYSNPGGVKNDKIISIGLRIGYYLK